MLLEAFGGGGRSQGDPREAARAPRGHDAEHAAGAGAGERRGALAETVGEVLKSIYLYKIIYNHIYLYDI